jgi:hypothetical protein
MGGEKVRYKDAFTEQRRYFIPYNNDLDEATDKLVGDAQQISGIQPKTWAYIYAAGLTAFLTFMRQVFAGFWFHPVGFIVGIGYDSLGERVWGSCLVAWMIRSLVLKLGGAVTVRNKLLPFFVGVFLGAVASYMVLFALNGYIFFFHPGMETHKVLF